MDGGALTFQQKVVAYGKGLYFSISKQVAVGWIWRLQREIFFALLTLEKKTDKDNDENNLCSTCAVCLLMGPNDSPFVSYASQWESFSSLQLATQEDV